MKISSFLIHASDATYIIYKALCTVWTPSLIIFGRQPEYKSSGSLRVDKANEDYNRPKIHERLSSWSIHRSGIDQSYGSLVELRSWSIMTPYSCDNYYTTLYQDGIVQKSQGYSFSMQETGRILQHWWFGFPNARLVLFLQSKFGSR